MIINKLFYPAIYLLINLQVILFAQTIKYENGTKIVENGKEGMWGNNPRVKLEYEGKFGNHNDNDESTFLTLPEDIAFDNQGNIYILDGGEQKIKKYDKSGKYILSFGGKGRGPGEMIMPTGINISPNGNIFVLDYAQQRINIYSPEGKSTGTIKLRVNNRRFAVISDNLIVTENHTLNGGGGTKPLFVLIDNKGNKVKEIGEGPFPKGGKSKLNGAGGGWNRINFTADKSGNSYAGFKFKDQLNKYDKDGKLILQIKTSHIGNFGIAVDSKERIWVLTQIKPTLKSQTTKPTKEELQKRTVVVYSKTEGKKIIRPAGYEPDLKCDLFALELYDKEGRLLCRYPLSHWLNGNETIKISSNKIYVPENINEGTFHVYKISDL